MFSNHSQPKWWQLYLIFPLLIALFAVDTRLTLSPLGHQALQIGSVLIIFGLVHLWLKANASALLKMDQRKYYGKVKVLHVPPYRLVDTNNYKRPMFQFPDSELKGTLSNTFEIDYIDTEFVSPVDEAHKN